MQGKIVRWNDERGFGFVETADGTHYYFHISDVQSRFRPQNGDKAQFRAGRGNNGKIAAREVTLAASKSTARNSQSRSARSYSLVTWRWIFVFALVCVFGWGVARDSFPIYLSLAYGLMSMASFVNYAIDKRAAQAGAWRVPEASLMGFDMAFGIVGGLTAQELLRHKTRKPNFVLAGIVTGTIHLGVMISLIMGIASWN